MVDWKAETTITTPNYQIMSVLHLEKQENCILAFELIETNDETDDYHNINMLKARLNTLRRGIRGWFIEVKKIDEYNKLVKLLESRKIKELEDAFNIMSDFLFDNGLTKINLRKPIKTVIAEEVNQYKGL